MWTISHQVKTYEQIHEVFRAQQARCKTTVSNIK